MSHQVIKDLFPPGGWHYINESPKYEIRGATSYDDTIKRLTEYRLNNKIDVGNPQEDIDNYLCKTFPRNCGIYDTVPEGTIATYKQSQRFSDRIIAWGNKQVEKAPQLKYVDSETANQRAMICQQCVMNIKWEHECPECVNNAQRLMTQVRGNAQRDLPHNIHDHLHGCGVGNFCTRTAVWLERECVNENVEAKNFPFHCWLKK